MNDFEKHILKNRGTLDRIEKPDADRVWQQLRRDLGHEPRVRRLPPWQWLSVAAAIVLILGIGITIGLHLQTSQPDTPIVVELPPELAERKQYYQQLVENKMEAMQYDTIDRRNFQNFFQELDKLEELHEQVLQDLPEYGANDQLSAALLKYYELKIRILERLEYEINKQQYHEKRIQHKSI